ncbi:hypothetical protein PHYPO_G00015590 [Pangasianodon hypophthalmus]|uniref:Uncharacterized protein n=1 Tax=Pangasianodon hypophthalmus TaxID=310915 RepID=A0A5N5N3Y8_PANHP|nr:hypothetical protein PHYPO_G00015590 [Pangasianodon hypophthalmus]
MCLRAEAAHESVRERACSVWCRDVARRNMHAKSEGETYSIIFRDYNAKRTTLSEARVVHISCRRGTLRYGHVHGGTEGLSKLTRPRGLLFRLASESPAIRHSLVDVHAPHVPSSALLRYIRRRRNNSTSMIQRMLKDQT